MFFENRYGMVSKGQAFHLSLFAISAFCPF